MKKLEIEKTKPTFIISTFKTDIITVGLVFSISNFFITKTTLANNWRRKKIPSYSYSALPTLIWDVINEHSLRNYFDISKYCKVEKTNTPRIVRIPISHLILIYDIVPFRT